MSNWMLPAIFIYLAAMLAIGALTSRKNKTVADYLLAGRNLGGIMTAVSAQMSDVNGWMLIGLPGLIYAFGANRVWTAIGLLIGSILNWLLVSERLHRYTLRIGGPMTIPEYLDCRFHDRHKFLLVVSSVVTVVFFTVYAASGLRAGGEILASVSAFDYHLALLLTAGVILAYTCMGGFLAVCTTNLIQGVWMFAGVLAVPILAVILVKPENLVPNLIYSDLGTDAKDYLNIFMKDGKPVSAVEIISQLAWGLGYFGMPHILMRFMAVRNERELAKSKKTAAVWAFVSVILACLLGVLGRAYLYPTVLSSEYAAYEHVYIDMIQKMFFSDFDLPFPGGILLCGILAAMMAAAASRLFAASSSAANDLCGHFLYRDRAKQNDRKALRTARICVLAVGLAAVVIAWNPDSSVPELIGYAWAGFGSAFGPVILLSLYWKRMTASGAAAGMIGGSAAVFIWDFAACVSVDGHTVTPADATGVYSLLAGFAASLLLIILVSLASPKQDKEILREFEDIR